MVKGLDVFKAHFASYAHQYVLIGGTACSVAMDEAQLDFRATKDLDIVLCVEALDSQFVRAFWDFVFKGRYEIQEASTGKQQFYRFQKPADESYPFMLELFSRIPMSLTVKKGAHLTPIPMDEEVSSLSAILLDGDYYEFIHSSRRDSDGLSVVGPDCLIPLKAKAWLDLSRRREAGDPVDRRDISKHKNDVFRLYSILDPEVKITLPSSVQGDFRLFLDKMEADSTLDLRALGLRGISLQEILARIRSIYRIERS